MPTVPPLSPEQMQQQQASGGINPAMFLVAAAQMHNEGALASPEGDKASPLPNKPQRSTKRLRLIR